MWAWIALPILAVLVAFFIVMAGLGRRLPEEHRTACTLRLASNPGTVWSLIEDTHAYPFWAPGVTKVERLADHDNREVWRHHMGRNVFTIETVESRPPHRLVREVADVRGPFHGRWEYDLAPDGSGCRVSLTECGTIDNPCVRAMMRYFFSESMYVRKHLAGVARKLGEPAARIDIVPPPSAVRA